MPLSPISRRRLMATTAAAFAAAGCASPLKALAPGAPTKAQALDTMKKATTFMVEKAAYNGGYVWSYLPDFSRRWGEMEAFPTMIWVQPPGTATMGHLFLDAYHATGDEYYYQAAVKAGQALIAIQHPAGGWNYIGDMAGEEDDAVEDRGIAPALGHSDAVDGHGQCPGLEWGATSRAPPLLAEAQPPVSRR